MEGKQIRMNSGMEKWVI